MPEDQKPARKFELSPAIAILLCGVLISGSIIFVNMHPAAATAPTENDLPTQVAVPPATAQDHIVGSLTAPIVLIEYSDFQCPYCGMVYPTLKRIVAESNGEIAWVHRNLPLESIHPQARPSALAAECVAEQLGNDGFWKFADAIYTDQKNMTPARYQQVAVQLGANAATFASCITTEKHADKIDSEALQAQSNGANGTPFTVIASSKLQIPISGALPYEQFSAVIKAVKARQ